MLGHQFRRKAADGVRVGDDGLSVVLRLVFRAAGRARDDKGALAGVGPIGRSLAGDPAVRHEPLGVADLVGRGLAGHDLMQMRLGDDMRVEQCEVVLPIRVEQPLLVPPAGLALVQGDQHRDRIIERDLHQDVVELFVIEAEHVQVERDADP